MANERFLNEEGLDELIRLVKAEKRVPGPKGDTGAKGEKGDTGPKGDTGAKGEKGDTGPKGDTGAKGEKGDTGPKGDTGAAMGRNLLRNTDFHTLVAVADGGGVTRVTAIPTGSVVTADAYEGMASLSLAKGIVDWHPPVVEGKLYTLSLWYQHTKGTSAAAVQGLVSIGLPDSAEWTRLEKTFTAGSSDLLRLYVPSADTTLLVCGMKLEEGASASAWTLCEADLLRVSAENTGAGLGLDGQGRLRLRLSGRLGAWRNLLGNADFHEASRLLTTTPAVGTGPQLIANGGTCEVDASVTVEGSPSVRMRKTGTSHPSVVWWARLEKGKQYHVSCWIKGAGKLWVEICMHDSDGKRYQIASNVTDPQTKTNYQAVADAWTLCEGTLTVPATWTDEADIGFRLTTAEDSDFWLARPQVEAGDAYTGWTPSVWDRFTTDDTVHDGSLDVHDGVLGAKLFSDELDVDVDGQATQDIFTSALCKVDTDKEGDTGLALFPGKGLATGKRTSDNGTAFRVVEVRLGKGLKLDSDGTITIDVDALTVADGKVTVK